MVLIEGGGIDEEGRNEVHSVGTGQLSRELRSPSLSDRALAKGTRFARKSGSKDPSVVLELVGMVRVRRNVGAKRGGIRCCSTRERAKRR